MPAPGFAPRRGPVTGIPALAIFALLLPIILLLLALYLGYAALLHLAIWLLWLPRNRRVLIVTSDSPVWSETMRREIIEPIGPRAVVLNWSERKRWPRAPRLAVLAFRFFGGRREFCPLAVVFRPFKAGRVFRFWGPFQQKKRGKPRALEGLKTDLLTTALGAAGSSDGGEARRV